MSAMASYAASTRAPRTLTLREQKALLKVTGEHRAGYRDHALYALALATALHRRAVDLGIGQSVDLIDEEWGVLF